MVRAAYLTCPACRISGCNKPEPALAPPARLHQRPTNTKGRLHSKNQTPLCQLPPHNYAHTHTPTHAAYIYYESVAGCCTLGRHSCRCIHRCRECCQAMPCRRRAHCTHPRCWSWGSLLRDVMQAVTISEEGLSHPPTHTYTHMTLTNTNVPPIVAATLCWCQAHLLHDHDPEGEMVSASMHQQQQGTSPKNPNPQPHAASPCPHTRCPQSKTWHWKLASPAAVATAAALGRT